MVFIWRGFGIVVPIVLLISGWITSYWITDTRLGNATFMGWSLLWAGIVLILAALAALGGDVDENGDPLEKSNKTHNDFFWLPIWLWSLCFIGLGIYFIYQDEPTDSSGEEPITTITNTYVNKKNVKPEKTNKERSLYFYNCASDSIEIEVIDPKEKVLFDFYVDGSDYSWIEAKPGDYTVNMNGSPYEIELRPVRKRNKTYNDAWMILCADVDLVLVEVTDICKADVAITEIKGVDWMQKVVDRYDGDYLIEPAIRTKKGEKVKVVEPNVYLPEKLKDNEKVYVLIAINADEDLSETFLDDKMIYLSVR